MKDSFGSVPRRNAVSEAILRQATSDFLRVFGMWFLPLLFLTSVSMSRNVYMNALFGLVGILVVAGTTSSIATIHIDGHDLKVDSVWTPRRGCVYVTMYIALWVFTAAWLRQ